MSIGMRMDLFQGQRMEQTLSPRMIQSMEILQLPIMELQARIEQELQENPALEQVDTSFEEAPAQESDNTEVDTPTEPTIETKDPGAEELVIDDRNGNEDDFDRLEALNRDWDDHFNEEHRSSRAGSSEESDKKHDAMQNMAAKPQSLQEYLADQVGFLDLPKAVLKRVRFLLSYIDDAGYLVPSAHLDSNNADQVEKNERELKRKRYLLTSAESGGEVLADLLQIYPEQPITLAELEIALSWVQKLEPRGVGARNLRECLLLQLTPTLPHYDVVRVLIENHLDDIQHNRLPNIQKHTGHDLHTIKEALESFRQLNPRPGAQFTAQNGGYVVPDILVEKNEADEYTVKLVDDWLPNVYISPRCRAMLQDRSSDPKTREYLKQKLQSAQWLLAAIKQRRGTLEKVSNAIIKHQKEFLDKGAEFIEPLKMQQIADIVGVHVTTVSRAVDDKWVQTPRGIFPLKRFFGGGKQTTTGEEVAFETIKQKLLEIIANEDKANPLSDEDLVIKLEEASYPVARRTVTKYRKMLNIPSSRQRKDWTLVQS